MEISKSDLERAINDNEFLLHYQAIVRYDPFEVSGAEALIRWDHPERGLLAPDDFLPAVYEKNMMVPLGKWVLQACVEQWQNWYDTNSVSESFFISMNCSEDEILSLDFINTLESTLENQEPLPSNFILELEEDAIRKLFQRKQDLKKQLQSMDRVELCIDNFGEFNPSMKKMEHLPTSIFKFDRQFLNPNNPSDLHKNIMQRLVGFANDLELTVIAEGIENNGQFDDFYNWGCDYAQGYYFSKPKAENPVQSLNVDQYKSTFADANQLSGSQATSTESKININHDFSLLLAVPDNPLQKPIKRALSKNDLQYRATHTFDAFQNTIETFTMDLVILDTEIAGAKKLKSLIQHLNQGSPDTHLLILLEKNERNSWKSFASNKHVDLLEKPIDQNKLLEKIAYHSRLIDRHKDGSSLTGTATSKLFPRRTSLFLAIVFVFSLLGLSLGFAITSARETITELFQTNQTLERKIDNLKQYIEKSKQEQQQQRTQ